MPRSPPPHPPSSYWIRLVGWLVEFFPSSSHKTNKKGWTTAQLTHALPLEQLTCFSHTGKSWRLGWGGNKRSWCSKSGLHWKPALHGLETRKGCCTMQTPLNSPAHFPQFRPSHPVLTICPVCARPFLPWCLCMGSLLSRWTSSPSA